jgi:hypothetical protein
MSILYYYNYKILQLQFLNICAKRKKPGKTKCILNCEKHRDLVRLEKSHAQKNESIND